MEIKLKRLHRDAAIPIYGTDGSACADLYAVEDVTIKPGEVKNVSCGWAMEIPHDYYVDIYPRGSMIAKQQVLPLCSPIDSDYRGPLFTYMKNIGSKDVLIKKGDRFAQMALKRRILMYFKEVNELTPTSRGAGGFGSTGK